MRMSWWSSRAHKHCHSSSCILRRRSLATQRSPFESRWMVFVSQEEKKKKKKKKVEKKRKEKKKEERRREKPPFGRPSATCQLALPSMNFNWSLACWKSWLQNSLPWRFCCFFLFMFCFCFLFFFFSYFFNSKRFSPPSKTLLPLDSLLSLPSSHGAAADSLPPRGGLNMKSS